MAIDLIELRDMINEHWALAERDDLSEFEEEERDALLQDIIAGIQAAFFLGEIPDRDEVKSAYHAFGLTLKVSGREVALMSPGPAARA